MKKISFIITKMDKIIIFISAIVVLGIFVGFYAFSFSTQPMKVIIEVDGKTYKEYSLSNIKGKKIVDVKTQYGQNKVEITSKYVQVLDANCPDKLDVKQGKITKANTAIVCLPNKMVVYLTGNNSHFDVIAN